jgi:hypothetical protein
MAGVALLVAVLTGGVIAARSDTHAPAAGDDTTGAVQTTAISRAPQPTKAHDDFVLAEAEADADATAAAVAEQTATPTPHVTPTVGAAAATPALTEAPTVTPVVSSVSATPTVGDAVSATPSTGTPATEPTLAPEAAALAAAIESRFGVTVATEGQHWGIDGAAQVRNLTSLDVALSSLPEAVVQAVNDNEGGPLVILSNGGGRTEDGWQPYGDRAANFYTNEDRGPDGTRAANEVVLQPGSNAQTIAHEVLHAYQMRALPPGDYVAGLLTPEMKSFMEATGWRQLVADDVVRAATSWETINSYFAYEGRPQNYENQYGSMVSLFAPNPLEAYAEAGGLYYARAFGTALPDWPEYWDWFDANVG